MSALTKQDASLPEVIDAAGLLDVIARAARDPSVDIDKLERLIAMRERVEAQQAKIAFTQAKLAMRPHLPVIDMRGRIVIRDKNNPDKIIQETPFARFEDIHAAIMPLLTEHGFDLSFKNGLSPDGKVRVTTILDHIAGHSEDTYFDLPHDSSGSKNAVQAVGSSTSYAKRYGVLSILNIRVSGEDDDGAATGDIVRVDGPKDAPFPQGPAKNITTLKAEGRDLWRDIEAVEDIASLNDLLAKNAALIEQLKVGLPSWWTGGQKDGNSFEGLEHVIARQRYTCEQLETAANMADLGRT